ncbi:MAG: TonB-dependent receptor [Oleiphilaceae bacterium]|nr:TonB-dependent receptor [Oleiphilaceae bacterium]
MLIPGSRRHTLPFLVLPIVSALSSVAFGQEEGSDTRFTLPTLEVQSSADASRGGLSNPYPGGQLAEGGRVGILGNQDVMETPYSFTSYTELLIEDQQAASVGEVLINDPAVRVARGFGNFQQVYLVRGLPIFSDDMTYNGLYGLLPRQYLASGFIQRVQVLRGANTFLKGAAPGGSGLGGAVNVVPKRAPNEPMAQLTLGSQGGEQSYAEADLARRTEDGRFGVRINAARRQGDTAVDGESSELTMSHIGLDYRGEALRVSADLGYQDHRLEASQPNITIGSGLDIPRAPRADQSVGQPWTFSDAEDYFATLRAEYDFSDSVTAWAAYGARDGREAATFANPTVNNADGDFTAFRFDNTREDSVNTGDLGVRTRFSTGSVGHELTVSGAYHEFSSRNAFVFGPAVTGNIYDFQPAQEPPSQGFAGGDLEDPLRTIQTRLSSVALADQLSLLEDALRITLGARYQRIEDFSYDFNTGEQISEYQDSAITPTLGVLYRLTPEVSTYANYIEGLQKGDTAPAQANSQPVVNAGESLEPFRTQQAEVGAKYDGGQIGGALSAYYSRKPVAGVDGNNVFRENDHQRNRGIELSAYGNATSQLTVLGGVSYLDAEVDGNEAIGSPDFQANLNLTYAVPVVPNLALDGRVIHTASQFADSDNQQEVPSWTRLDLGARYQVELSGDRMVTFRARVENVADRDYWASAGGFPGAGYLTVGGPRTLLASATIDF